MSSLLRCPRCTAGLTPASSGLNCAGCDANFHVRDGILIVKEQADQNNRVAQEFYDSALWPRFRFWEKFTWWCNGGERQARNQVLKHLPRQPGLNLLDVAVGDGVYLPWMPADWHVFGIDVSWSQLRACLDRAVGPQGRTDSGRSRDAAVSRRPVRRGAEHWCLQLFQRPGRCAAGDGSGGPSRCDDRHLRRDAQLDRSDARPQTGAAGPRSLDRLAAHAPGRQLYRNGRAVPRHWTSSRLPAAFCPRSSITKSGVGSVTCWSAERRADSHAREELVSPGRLELVI